jgi:hypothetical protein
LVKLSIVDAVDERAPFAEGEDQHRAGRVFSWRRFQLPFAAMEIRAELPDDHEAVLEVNRRAFGASGSKVADLVSALRHDDPGGLSLVAEDTGRARYLATLHVGRYVPGFLSG